MRSSRAKQAAVRLLGEFGLDDVIDIDLQDLVCARDILYRETPLGDCEGRIVFGNKGHAIITVNSETSYIPRKRFSIAHELGHFELKHREIHFDNEASLDYYKYGNQETEANEFASELLLPSAQFEKAVSGKAFSPLLIDDVARKFGTSLSSALFKYVDYGSHPIMVIYSYNGKVKYIRKSQAFTRRVIDYTNLSVPSNSVTEEWFKDHTVYGLDDIQTVDIAVWFDLSHRSRFDDFDEMSAMCNEHCFVSERFNTAITVVWED